MPTNIPTGFHIFSASFTCVGSTHVVVSTCAGANGAATTAAQINANWRNALVNITTPLGASHIPTPYTLIETKILANILGTLYVDQDFTQVAGTSSIAPPPINTALLVKKNAGIAGRPYQARFFWPPAVAEGDVDAAGIIGSSPLILIQGQWTTAFTNLGLNDVEPVIIHDPALALAPTPIVSFDVQARLGTIGRRMRR